MNEPKENKLVKALNSVEAVICGILVLILFIVLLWQTFGRNLGMQGVTWTDETARYLFVLLVYVGAGMAMLKGKHVKIEIMIEIWPKPIRKYIRLIGCILAAVFCAYVFINTLKYNVNVMMKNGRVSPAILISMWIPYTAVNIGYGLMLIRLIQVEVRRNLRVVLGKEKSPEEIAAEKKLAQEGGAAK